MRPSPWITVLISFALSLTDTAVRCNTIVDVTSPSLQFVVLGDSGGVPLPPYRTFAQTAFAKTVLRIPDVDFGLLLGDNFYFTGVADVDDSRFQTSFDDLYIKPMPNLTYPWYPIAGNHDHLGDYRAQLDYSKRQRRWVYPDTFHTVVYRWPAAAPTTARTTAEFVFIDTVKLCGNLHNVTNGTFMDMLLAKHHKQPIGPPDPPYAERKWTWIDRQLAKSTADYLFVVGHYPVHSAGLNGPIVCLVDLLKPMLHKYNVTAYFAGHDHCLQHITDTVNGTTVDYVISAAASRTDDSRTHVHTMPHRDALRFIFPPTGGLVPYAMMQMGILSDAGGVIANLTKESGELRFVNVYGNTMYRLPVHPRNLTSS